MDKLFSGTAVPVILPYLDIKRLALFGASSGCDNSCVRSGSLS